jgi:hypothetical protein
MDSKTLRVERIGYAIRIREEAALRGDGKILVGMSGVRLDRVAMPTAVHIGMFNLPEGATETLDLQGHDEEHSNY